MSKNSRSTTPYQRPDELLWRTEPMRAAGDFIAFWAALPTLVPAGAGDGHGVLVLPGFLADDMSTYALRSVLTAHGYRAIGWDLGTNLGPTSRLWGGAGTRLRRLHRQTGRPVTLIGQSLGGIFARELAREFPQMVRQVITLGSPYRLTTEDGPETTTVGHLYHALRGLHSHAFGGPKREEERVPLAMPATSIYSRADGVVPWKSCVDVERAQSESLEVAASHCGMGMHPEVLRIVFDRLRQPEGEWTPYRSAQSTALAS